MDQADRLVAGQGRESAGCATQNAERGANEKVAYVAKEQREARFDEVGLEQKIGRLRDALLSLAATSERASHQASEANRIAKVHDHGSGGQVVVPLEGDNRALALMEGGEGPLRRIQRLLG